jgi:hypothetical protein
MSSSSRWSGERAVLAAAAVSMVVACSHARPLQGREGARPLRVAMFPPHDLAGAPEAALPVTRALEEAFARAGLEVVSGVATESSLGKHRVRWVGGVDSAAAQAIREDLGVDAVVVTAVQDYAAGPAPQLSMSVRLVSVAGDPRILWVGRFSRSGEESRGLLGLGAIGDLKKLQRIAASELGRSLEGFLRGDPAREARCKSSGVFAPRLVHRQPFVSGERPRIAVLPFLNRTSHENAGEVLALEFIGQLAAAGRFEVVDPGVVRSVLLANRIVIRGGVSFDEATSLLEALDADLVLSGEVTDFEEAGGRGGVPSVQFTARFLDRGENVVWQSLSRNTGSDAVRLFDFGAVRTTSALACRMISGIVAELAAIGRSTSNLQQATELAHAWSIDVASDGRDSSVSPVCGT